MRHLPCRAPGTCVVRAATASRGKTPLSSVRAHPAAGASHVRRVPVQAYAAEGVEEARSSRDGEGTGTETSAASEASFAPGDVVVGRICKATSQFLRVELLDHPGWFGIVFTQEFPTVFGRPSARADGTKPSASDLSGTVREFRIGDVADDMTPTRGPVLLARTHDDMLRGDRAKQLLEACLTDRETFMAKVFSVNKGGVLASVAGLTLFVPNSHLIRDADTEVRKQFRKGTEIELTLMRVDEPEDFRHGQAKILASMTLARQAHAYKRICVGALVSGKVRRIEPFGAYVGIDGTSISGLLHVSNLSGRYVEAISDVLSVGEPVKAIVMGMEEGYRQISLSTAELEDYPGQIQEEKATVMAAAERRAEEFRERFDQWMEEEGTEREDGSWMYESSEDDVGA